MITNNKMIKYKWYKYSKSSKIIVHREYWRYYSLAPYHRYDNSHASDKNMLNIVHVHLSQALSIMKHAHVP